MRAVAILTVVAYHVGLRGSSGGYIGVDVFFVISGYLITSLLVGEAERNGRIDLAGFYARRVRRLLPAFLTVLVATLALGALFFVSFNGSQQGLAKSAIASLLLNANHYFWVRTGGYFDPPAEYHPLLHLWSLAVEEQFYLLWPAALVGLLGAGSATTLRRRLIAALAVAVPASWLFGVWLLSTAPAGAFYLMPARAWELGAGALIALVLTGARPVGAFVGSGLSIAGIAAIGLSVVAFDRTTPFPGWAALLPVAGSAAVLAGGVLAPRSVVSLVLASRPLVGIGRISYSWYLWHWPLLAVARSRELGAQDPARDVALAGLLAFGLACATYRWIEQPMRRGSWPMSGPARQVVAAGALLSIGCLVPAVALGAWARFGPKSTRELEAMRARMDWPPLRSVCQGTLAEPARLRPKELCLVPAPGPRVDVVLWGDSQADHWMPALTELSKRSGLAVLEITRASCPPLLGYSPRNLDQERTRNCMRFLQLAIDEIARLRSESELEAVVLAASWTEIDVPAFGLALTATLDRLERSNLRVLIVGPTPMLPFDAPECVFRHGGERCALPRTDFERQRRTAVSILQAAVNRRSSVRLFDPAPYFCDSRRCPPIQDGRYLFSDNEHVSATASRAIGGAASSEWAWLRGSGVGPLRHEKCGL